MGAFSLVLSLVQIKSVLKHHTAKTAS